MNLALINELLNMNKITKEEYLKIKLKIEEELDINPYELTRN